MKSVEQHQADVLSGISPLDPLDLRLLDAQGCTLSDDVTAPWDLPPFTNSAMDGYAVRASDVAKASESNPVTLPVVGDIPAGHSGALGVSPGQTARIMTGAPMPAGADAVVPLEWTDEGLVDVVIRRAPEPDQFVRHQGSDTTAGSTVLTAGTRLGAPQIGLLAAVGRSRVVVRPRPRVVVMSTGSELVEPGEPITGGKIPDSNSFMLSAAAHAAGATAYRIGFVPDEATMLMSTIEDQLIRADMVITTGGVSVGAYDIVKATLAGWARSRSTRSRCSRGCRRDSVMSAPTRRQSLRCPAIRCRRSFRSRSSFVRCSDACSTWSHSIAQRFARC